MPARAEILVSFIDLSNEMQGIKRASFMLSRDILVPLFNECVCKKHAQKKKKKKKKKKITSYSWYIKLLVMRLL